MAAVGVNRRSGLEVAFPKAPVAFISYAHRDDRAYGGKISMLRRQLQDLVGAAIGRDFEIFQDVDGVAWVSIGLRGWTKRWTPPCS
jgi:hypothetical protein